MNKELKSTIKAEVKAIIAEIELEEAEFNRMFHSDVQFQKSYYKFKTIFDKYGKEAYLKYVPYKYKKLELKGLIFDEDFVGIYERYGMKVIKKLLYTKNLYSDELKVTNKFKILVIKLKKMFSRNFIPITSQAVLMLPEGVENSFNNENTSI